MKKIKKIFIIPLIKFYLLIYFNASFVIANDENNPNKVDIFNEKVVINNNIEYDSNFVQVLKGIGFLETEALNASKALSLVYPLDILKSNNNLILPRNIGKEKKFAVTVNDSEAIILKEENKKFSTFLTNTKLASQIVVNLNNSIDKHDNIIEIENLNPKNIEKLVYKNFVFKEGESLINLMNDFFEKKKNLNKFITSIRNVLNPSTIQIGTIAKVIINDNKLLAFYMPISSKEALITYMNQGLYDSKIIKISNIEKFLNEKILKNITYNNKLVTRINLFKNRNYNIRKNFLKKGQSIYELLRSYKVQSLEINNILNKIKPHFDLRQIKAGKTIEIIFNNNELLGLSYGINETTKLQVAKVDNEYKVYFYYKPYKKKLTYNNILINTNFYVDSQRVNLPKSIFIDLVRLLSFSLDFQRDVQKHTKFEVLYEKLYDYDNNFIRSGKILYSKVLINKNIKEMFYFKRDKQDGEYFDSKGKSIKKTLMKTPIDGARLSSGFGKRKHPILGYNKMHKGLDFAASKGTPIYAAGDGIIERANYFGAYGRYIRIRHNSEYKTAYAHLSKFAKGIRKNVRVKQGEIIGFVGSSGRTTGPHLHYEVLFNKVQINPYKLKMPEAEKLKESELISFSNAKVKIQTILGNIKK